MNKVIVPLPCLRVAPELVQEKFTKQTMDVGGTSPIDDAKDDKDDSPIGSVNQEARQKRMIQSNELNETQKLQLAERANEIYRQQLKYMQDHLGSLRSLIDDKENIIENLMLRYDLGIITQDQNRRKGNLARDDIEMEELRRKAEALAQRTVLENFDMRETVNDLRDENSSHRKEIYEIVCTT